MEKRKPKLAVSKLDAGLGFDAGSEWVLEERHFCCQIRDIQQLVPGVPPGQNHVRLFRFPVQQEAADLLFIQVSVPDGDVDLIKQDELDVPATE